MITRELIQVHREEYFDISMCFNHRLGVVRVQQFVLYVSGFSMGIPQWYDIEWGRGS